MVWDKLRQLRDQFRIIDALEPRADQIGFEFTALFVVHSASALPLIPRCFARWVTSFAPSSAPKVAFSGSRYGPLLLANLCVAIKPPFVARSTSIERSLGLPIFFWANSALTSLVSFP